MKKFLYLLLIPFASCKMQLDLPQDFEQKAPYQEASNRQSWPFKRTVRAGDFMATNHKRGFTDTYQFTFIKRYAGAKERFRFVLREQQAPRDTLAMVFSFARIKQENLPMVFDIVIKYENIFTTKVIYYNDDGRKEEWDLVLNEPYMYINPKNHKAIGQIAGPGLRYYSVEGIHHVRRPSGRRYWMTRPAGFAILKEGQIVAATYVINKGGLYLASDLDKKEKELLAAFCFALMLRRDLRDSNPALD
jgi:hypothetical protein